MDVTLRRYDLAVSVTALALAEARQNDAPEGTLIVAEHELTPRGRRAEGWTSVAGASLAAALVLRPALPPQGEGLLWLLASVAAAEGVAAASGLDVRTAWPDGLVVGSARVGMVDMDAQLGPGRIDSAVLTLRVQVGAAAGDDSLAALGADTTRERVLESVLDRLAARYDDSVSALLAAYTDRCATLGTTVRAEMMPRGDITGVATGVDEGGNLVVETPAGPRPVALVALRQLTQV